MAIRILLLFLILFAQGVSKATACGEIGVQQNLIIGLLEKLEGSDGARSEGTSAELAALLLANPEIFALALKKYDKEVIRFDVILLHTSYESVEDVDDLRGLINELEDKKRLIADTVKDDKLRQDWIRELESAILRMKKILPIMEGRNGPH